MRLNQGMFPMGVDKQLNSCHRVAGEALPVPVGFNAIESLAPGLLQVASDWVAVKEQSPTQSGNYLVLLRDRSYRIMGYAVNSETFFPRGLHQAVTHWRELPPLPV